MMPLLLFQMANGAAVLILKVELARLTIVGQEIRKVVVNE